ncbi:MAG: transposase, partial [bacterium]|nr:transposase [bacterium]
LIEQTIQATRVVWQGPCRQGHRLPDVELTAIRAREKRPPKGEQPIEWVLLTSRPAQTLEQALEILQWYLCRWQVEIYFKILKSGCKVEELQLERLTRLEPALAFYMMVAWRVL